MSTLEGTPTGRTAGELLALTDVSKSYRRGSQELRVLRGVSLDVAPGEVVCVLGVRGQGKTTLLRIAAGMESADTGVVRFAGEDLQALSDAELSRLLGQRIAWAGKRGPRTRVRMFDYVAMPLLARAGSGARRGNRIGRSLERRAYRRGVDARARAALERVGASACAEQRWETMSDWERALVEVAQAIAGEPALLVVDDVTDNLGVCETDAFTALLRSLSREAQLSVLMGASDPQATLLCDRIATLAGGRLTQGPKPPGGKLIRLPDLATAPSEAGYPSIV
jgi:ABC-type lipoprotein export system ATPase subunit